MGSRSVFSMRKDRSRMGAPDMLLPSTASLCISSPVISWASSSKNLRLDRARFSSSLRLTGSPCSTKPCSRPLMSVTNFLKPVIFTCSSSEVSLSFSGARLYTMRWGTRKMGVSISR
ncbi:MAG: hypothetical protein BWX71_02211 [Deltaproteobacteria bacterium ADurb.Bin072]|nr:MAG: hypothetical protein BWX71_02211 [Deltaproteobacteria bacterium ADurb.Bin072]